MPLIATNPSASRPWSPSLYSRQKRQSSGSEDPLLRNRRRADTDELAHGRHAEPGRMVVAVAAAGPIDENEVVRPELRAPALDARLVGGSAEPRASVLLDLGRNRVLGGGPGSRAWRVRKDVDLRDPGRANEPNRTPKRQLVLRRKADDHVRRQVEVAKRFEAAEVGRARVAAGHRLQHDGVARLPRHVQGAPQRRRLTQRPHDLL